MIERFVQANKTEFMLPNLSVALTFDVGAITKASPGRVSLPASRTGTWCATSYRTTDSDMPSRGLRQNVMMRAVEVFRDDDAIRQLMAHVHREADLLGRYIDLVAWLRPDLRLSGGRRAKAGEVLHRLEHGVVDRRSLRSVRDLLLLIDRIARTYAVSEQANGFVHECLKELVRETFDQDAVACLALLDAVDANLTNQQVRALVNGVKVHYREVLELTKLLKGYIGDWGNEP